MSLLSFREVKIPESATKVHSQIENRKVLIKPIGKGGTYGLASYYGKKWNGRTTANMEIYNCELHTCASPTLPFNTILRVTNLDNGKTIIVRVNDRGPYKMDKKGKALFPLIPHPKRILDLSRKSFMTIGDLKKGLLNIKYEIVG